MLEKIYLSAKDVSELLEVSLSKAYSIIREMNKTLAERGYLVLPGKVPTEFFKEQWYGLA